ncbi:hypothetical protein DFQ30_001150 [Apophysomyces sp. BC1015]|nr:hypothetical protein DFQ30_001150 [Apophysomyces sp. BC1015]
MTTTTRMFPCMELTDIRGQTVQVNQLAAIYRVFLITLKHAKCPVCPQLLHILNLYGLDPNKTTYTDPFTHEELGISPNEKNFFQNLLQKDAYFIVVCPGSSEFVADIQQRCNFRYPFVAGDQAMTLGKALRLNMSEKELWPAIVELSEDASVARPVSIGRSPGRYSHNSLFVSLITLRIQKETHGNRLMHDANDLVRSIKRRMIKCRESKLASSSLQLVPPRLPVSVPTSLSSSHAPPPAPVTPLTDGDHTYLQNMPTEILGLVFSFIPETAALMEAARTCRLFYLTACDSLVDRLGKHVDSVAVALPQHEGQMTQESHQRTRDDWSRWEKAVDAAGFRDLQRRILALESLVSGVGKWTRQWGARRRTMVKRDLS